MYRFLLICLLCSLLGTACSRNTLIPPEELSDIYYDIYLLDQSLNRNHEWSRSADTLRIYRPLIEKHGWTFEDYAFTVEEYIKRPDRFEEVFDLTIEKLESRRKVLEKAIALQEKDFKEVRFRDSVLVNAADSATSTLYLRSLGLLFFEKDTSLIFRSPVPDSLAAVSYIHHVLEIYHGDPFSCDSSFRAPLSPVRAEKQ